MQNGGAQTTETLDQMLECRRSLGDIFVELTSALDFWFQLLQFPF